MTYVCVLVGGTSADKRRGHQRDINTNNNHVTSNMNSHSNEEEDALLIDLSPSNRDHDDFQDDNFYFHDNEDAHNAPVHRNHSSSYDQYDYENDYDYEYGGKDGAVLDCIHELMIWSCIVSYKYVLLFGYDSKWWISLFIEQIIVSDT